MLRETDTKISFLTRYGREGEDVEREGEREGGEREREREREREKGRERLDSHIFLPIMFTAQQNKIKPKQEHKLK